MDTSFQITIRAHNIMPSGCVILDVVKFRNPQTFQVQDALLVEWKDYGLSWIPGKEISKMVKSYFCPKTGIKLADA